jgi:hypothetical protein
MTKDMESGEGMALAAEAMTIAMAHPLAEAIEQLKPYSLEADEPEELLLALHVRYHWPLPELASVLLAVHDMTQVPEATDILIEKPDDTILPMQFRLTTGELVRVPTVKTTVKALIEEELPDGWNTHRPHSTEEVIRRNQISQDIGEYLAEGVTETMRTDEPKEHLCTAAELIEPFNLYAERLLDSTQFFEAIAARRQLRDQRRRELHDILRVDTGLERLESGVKQKITDWFMGLLEELGQFVPEPPAYIQNIPRRGEGQLSMRQRDEQLVEEDSRRAHQLLEDWAQAGKTDLAVFLYTQPDGGTEDTT